MPTPTDAPMTPLEVAEYHTPTTEGRGPYGHVTASANAFWTPEGTLEVVRSETDGDVVHLKSQGALLPGLPGRSSHEEEARTRTRAERRDASAMRQRHGPDPRTDPGESANVEANEAYCPADIPRGSPSIVSSLNHQRYTINSRGNKVELSQHSTIIGGESRELIYPSNYPYTAVCKIYPRFQATAGGPWLYGGEATGFMVGPRVMVTSGHVQPPGGTGWLIEVIPACWNGQSVFGAGMRSFVSDRNWWQSDAGSDIQICRLFDPLGDSVGWFGTKNYDADWEDGDYWNMAGFPFDINLTHMSRETAIAVRDDDDGDDIGVDGANYDTTQVESDADEASGASGSPLWGDWDGLSYAIGIHSGVQHDGTISGTETLSCAAGGDGFLEAVNWARRMWG